MIALIVMNAFDEKLQGGAITMPISFWLSPSFIESAAQYHIIERSAWWAHIIGVFAFLN